MTIDGETLRWPGAHPYLSAWAAMLAGPIAWFLNLVAVYALTLHVCSAGHRLALHLSTLACLGIAASGGATAWFNWVRTGRLVPSDSDDGDASQVGFLSLLGLMSASLFALLILPQWIAIFALDPCPP